MIGWLDGWMDGWLARVGWPGLVGWLVAGPGLVVSVSDWLLVEG